MSNGIVARLGNLWKGFVRLWISDIEKEHPEIAYENAINSMAEKYAQLKRATASIIRRREETAERVASRSKELTQIEADLGVAMESSQDDLSLVLIQKKNMLTSDLTELHKDMEVAQKDAEDAKGALLNVQAEIRRLQAEKDTMLAKMASAQARVRINEQLEGISIDAEVKALDNVRTHIKNVVAEANLGAELNSSDLDTRLAGLRQQAGNSTAKQQLEQMKATMAAKRQTVKTM